MGQLAGTSHLKDITKNHCGKIDDLAIGEVHPHWSPEYHQGGKARSDRPRACRRLFLGATNL